MRVNRNWRRQEWRSSLRHWAPLVLVRSLFRLWRIRDDMGVSEHRPHACFIIKVSALHSWSFLQNDSISANPWPV